MTDRKRSPLPEGYQYGDAGKGLRLLSAAILRDTAQRNGATISEPEIEILSAVIADHWNVIEGEHGS